jgi:5-(carboxyamino)imidazole ribonucleotide mutase
MPKGIPVATVAIDGAENAGILAAQILGVYDESIAEKLVKFKNDMVEEVIKKDEKLQTEMWWKM